MTPGSLPPSVVVHLFLESQNLNMRKSYWSAHSYRRAVSERWTDFVLLAVHSQYGLGRPSNLGDLLSNAESMEHAVPVRPPLAVQQRLLCPPPTT
jgi:hypothetical protein